MNFPPSLTKKNLNVPVIIILLTVIVFLIQNLSKLLIGVDLPLALGAKINMFIMRGELWRLVTPVLLHGSVLHIGFNMYALYSVGPILEKKYGKRAFIALYLISAIWGNVFSFILTENPSLGASTAIFGLIAAQGVYIYKNQLFLGSAARPLLMNIAMVILVNLMLGLSPGIDNWGHLGGLFGGFIFAWFAGPSYELHQNDLGQNVVVNNARKPYLILAAAVVLAFGIVMIRIFTQ